MAEPKTPIETPQEGDSTPDVATVQNPEVQEPAPDSGGPEVVVPEVTPQPDVVAPPTLPDVPDTHHHVAIRDFAASFEHQVLRFAKDEVIDSRVGRFLRGNGAPIKLVEKPTSGETKDLA